MEESFWESSWTSSPPADGSVETLIFDHVENCSGKRWEGEEQSRGEEEGGEEERRGQWWRRGKERRREEEDVHVHVREGTTVYVDTTMNVSWKRVKP